MKPDKLSLNQLKERWNIEANNILDIVEMGDLPVFVRYCKFEYQDGSFELQNEKIWGNNSTDNKQNIRMLREAVNANLLEFKLILSEEQKVGRRKSVIDFESHRQYPKDHSIVINGKTVNFFDHLGMPTLLKKGEKEPVSVIDLVKQGAIERAQKSMPSRFEENGPFTVIKSENTIYSNPVLINDIYFLDIDVQLLEDKNGWPSKIQLKQKEPSTATLKYLDFKGLWESGEHPHKQPLAVSIIKEYCPDLDPESDRKEIVRLANNVVNRYNKEIKPD